MCKGTRCEHEKDPAVQWLEHPYGGWEYKLTPLYEETTPGTYRDEIEPCAYVLRVKGRNTHDSSGPLSLGPSHDQPMIRLKNDLGRYENYPDDEADAMAARYMQCPSCNTGHRCSLCETPVTHMATGLCVRCWNGDRSPV